MGYIVCDKCSCAWNAPVKGCPECGHRDEWAKEEAIKIVSWHHTQAPVLELDIQQALDSAERRGFERGVEASAEVADARRESYFAEGFLSEVDACDKVLAAIRALKGSEGEK